MEWARACWTCKTRVPGDLLGNVYAMVLYWTFVWLLEGLEGLNHLGMCSWSLQLFLHIFSFIRPLEDLKPCLGINEISSSFFSLLLEILLLEGQASLPMVRVLEKSDVHQFSNCRKLTVYSWRRILGSSQSSAADLLCDLQMYPSLLWSICGITGVE